MISVQYYKTPSLSNRDLLDKLEENVYTIHLPQEEMFDYG